MNGFPKPHPEGIHLSAEELETLRFLLADLIDHEKSRRLWFPTIGQKSNREKTVERLDALLEKLR